MADPADPKPPLVAPTFPATAEGMREAAAYHRGLEADHRRLAEAYERAVAAFTGRAPLHGEVNTGNSTGNMVTDRRLAISKGRTGKDKFAIALREHKFTLRSLAKKLGCSHTMLSMHRKDGGRPIPRDRAEAIEKLTGWPADAAHWPNNIA